MLVNNKRIGMRRRECVEIVFISPESIDHNKAFIDIATK